MKRKLRNAISAILILALIASMTFSTFASEKTLSKEKEPLVVTCIGDSIASGCALFRDTEISGNFPIYANGEPSVKAFKSSTMSIRCSYDSFFKEALTAYYSDPDYKGVVKAFEERMLSGYPIQVAMTLNGVSSDSFAPGTEDTSIADQLLAATDYRCLAYNAMSSIDFRRIYQPDYIIPEGAASLLGSSSGPDSADVQNGMVNSDLLIYALGGNDLLSSVMFAGLTGDTSSASDIVSNLAKTFAINLQAYNDNTEYILSRYLEDNPGASAVLVGLYNPLLDNDITTFLDPESDNYILNLIKYANPDSVMGYIYLAFEDVIRSIDNDTAKVLGNSISLAVSAINTNLRLLADRYENTYFVDINGCDTRNETVDPETGYVALSGDGFHASVSGHDYIARRILSALPENLQGKPSRTIKVDLSAVPGTVTTVLVNNVVVNNYSISPDGYTLSIPYPFTTAMTVSVFTKGSSIGVTTWQCQWNRTDGYRVYILGKNSDLSKTPSVLYKSVKSGLKTVVSKINSLFQ